MDFCEVSVWNIWPFPVLPEPSRVGKAREFGLQPRSVPLWWECFTFWMSRRLGCTNGTMTSWLRPWNVCAIWEILWLSWNTTKTRCVQRTILWMLDRVQAYMAEKLSVQVPSNRSRTALNQSLGSICPAKSRYRFRWLGGKEMAAFWKSAVRRKTILKELMLIFRLGPLLRWLVSQDLGKARWLTKCCSNAWPMNWPILGWNQENTPILKGSN